MNAEEALRIVETALGEERLSKLQGVVFRHTWNELSYQEIARDSGYEVGYIKQTGSQMWQMLSNALGEKVRKGNVHVVLKRYTNRKKAEGRAQAAEDGEMGRWGDGEPSSTQHSALSIQHLASIHNLQFTIHNSPAPHTLHSTPYTDWGEATDVSIFYGRTEELALLEQWILHDRCRLVGLFGMGGIGKTALSVKLAQQLSHHTPHTTHPTPFSYIIWRSLRNAPPIHYLLADLILFLSGQQETVLPNRLDQRILRLLDYLRHYRCLVILDNAETVMQAGDREGNYQPGYEGYGQLLRCVGETDHQSCLLLTSREKPKGFAPREGAILPVRSLQVTGLNSTIGRELLNVKGRFTGSPENWHALIDHYAGNPLALKIVATAIADFFDGSIDQFLEFVRQGNSVFGDIRDLLGRQIGRLSNLEQQVMFWLAINREPISFKELQSDCIPIIPPTHLLDILTALERRSLIEKSHTLFTLQPAVMEYMTEQLIEQVYDEIAEGREKAEGRGQRAEGEGEGGDEKAEGRGQRAEADAGIQGRGDAENVIQNSKFRTQNSSPTPHSPLPTPHLASSLLRSHALIKAQAKDYVRETQIRLILQPICDRLLHRYHRLQLDDRLMRILSELRGKADLEIGYIGGNVVNLLCQLEMDLNGRDFSRLTIWQAYLCQATLHNTNLADSDLAKSVFTETFSQILAVAFSPNGKLLAASDISYEAHVWRVTDGKKLLTCKASDGWAWSVAFSPDSCLLASSANGTIHLWDMQTGECIQTICGYTSRVFSLAFSPDGCLLASGNEDHEIRIWEIATGDLVAVLSGHTDEVRCVTFNPNGTLLASSSYDRTIKLWDISGIRGQKAGGDTETRRHGDMESRAEDKTQSSVLSPQSSVSTQTSRIQNSPGSSSLTAHASLRTLPGHTHWVWSVAFSPDGTTLASSSSDCTLKLWDLRTGRCIKTLSGHSQPIRSVAFLQGVGVSSQESEFTQNLKLKPQNSSPTSHSPLPTPYLVSGSDDRTIRLWDREGNCLRVLQGHTSWISAVAVSPDGCLLASGSEDQSVRLWDSQTSQCLRVLQGYNSGVWSIAFSPDGKTLISGGQDRMVRVWELEGRRQEAEADTEIRRRGDTEQKAEGRGQEAEGNAQSSFLSSQSSTSIQHSTFNIQKPLAPSPFILSAHTSWIWSVAVSPDGEAIASSSEDGTIHLWNIAALGEQEPEVRSQKPEGRGEKAEGRWQRAKGEEGEGDGGDREGGNSIQNSKFKTQNSFSTPHTPHPTPHLALIQNSKFKIQNSSPSSLLGHTHAVWSVAFSPNGCLLASGSLDGSVRLWNRFTGQCLQILRQHQSGVWSVAFSPNVDANNCDRQLLASGSQDQTIQLWEITTPLPASRAHQASPELIVHPLRTLEGHTSWIRCIAFRPDGQTLASASSDGAVKLWQVTTGECLHTFQAHSSLVLAITFSPDGQTIATGGGDGTIKLWDGSAPTPLLTLQGHHKWVRYLAYSPTGEVLASCSQDGSVKLWDLGRLTSSNGEPHACLETLRVPRPYEGTNIAGINGLTRSPKRDVEDSGSSG
ncbi:WD40 repeat domain-containing protein [Kovacikia minuta CCNUW1]|uniref:WD40 repeat domain-containing protein n=1 Tax=Kovacikia minuta TaxID=2931930 RepID=UPI001CCBEEC3|nr:WD40 repeat domain-containing protein [Kovacikia minuta]UBF24245.1 WD40 repeat domain-containing protein [Kovacikia minuta CCNUW1]